jgi:phosphoribosylformylglycinamidine synthase
MPVRLEVASRERDVRGENLKNRIQRDLGIETKEIKIIEVYTIDASLSEKHLESVKMDFADPVTQVASFSPLAADFEWLVEVSFLGGVKDNAGDIAKEAIQHLLGKKLESDEKVYFSRQYLIKGEVSRDDLEKIAKEMLSNDLIEEYTILDFAEFKDKGIPLRIPQMKLDQRIEVKEYDLEVSDEKLEALSVDNNWALSLEEMKVVRDHFRIEEVVLERKKLGLGLPTDVELEAIAQTQSEHCKHKIFNAKIIYKNKSGETETIDSLFKTFIKATTEELAAKNPWVISTLKDNAGVIRLNEDWYFVTKCETHNSPSNLEPYGGSLTGIVGVYRDPMGTGRGAKIVSGGFGFCTGSPFYDGELDPRIKPRRLLEGIRKGVEDGGNQSGVPTIGGYVFFDEGYIAKPCVFVRADGVMPAELQGESSHIKHIEPGDLVVSIGGRVGMDGIHGVTEASMGYGKRITAGHVQIGDPYTQKKVHDMLLEATARGLVNGLTDCGGGGLSSAVGEIALYSGGVEVDLEKVLLKYEGMLPWQIWVSESQERMVLSVQPSKKDEFLKLAEKHGVETCIIGRFTDSGKLHIRYDNGTVAYLDLKFLHEGFPQWILEAEWESKTEDEPTIEDPEDHSLELKMMLSHESIASIEYIFRQYDHEVQGTSVVKPLVGRESDVQSDASVIRPVLGCEEGIAAGIAIAPRMSRIDTYWMAANAIDEAVRRVLAVGGTTEQIATMDNFCWPGIHYDPEKNPDGKHKLAQLVEANKALRDFWLAYNAPAISGKDSMSMDGTIPLKSGGKRRISSLPTLQVTALSLVTDVSNCVTMDAKVPGDLIYVLGETRNELGASAYYSMKGFTGRNVPKVDSTRSVELYRSLEEAIGEGLVSSSHGLYAGGLAVALAQTAFAGGLGFDVDLRKVAVSGIEKDHQILYSESASRFVVTISPEARERFESIMKDRCSLIGLTTDDKRFVVKGLEGNVIIRGDIDEFKESYKSAFKGF